MLTWAQPVAFSREDGDSLTDHVEKAVNQATDGTLLKFYRWSAGIVVVAAMAHLSWLTADVLKSRDFRLAGDRWTRVDAAEYAKEVDRRFNELPSGDTRKRLSDLETKYDSLIHATAAIRSDISVIKVILERIEKQK